MRELPILTNCGVSSFSNSALFKLRERRFSVRIRVIFSCSEREMTQLHILTRLDAEQHLRYEPSERLCQALTELRGKLRQLRFESGSNFAIVHRGTPPWWFGFLVKTLLPRISSPPTSQSRQATDLSRVRLSVLQILGKLLEFQCAAGDGEPEILQRRSVRHQLPVLEEHRYALIRRAGVRDQPDVPAATIYRARPVGFRFQALLERFDHVRPAGLQEAGWRAGQGAGRVFDQHGAHLSHRVPVDAGDGTIGVDAGRAFAVADASGSLFWGRRHGHLQQRVPQSNKLRGWGGQVLRHYPRRVPGNRPQFLPRAELHGQRRQPDEADQTAVRRTYQIRTAD